MARRLFLALAAMLIPVAAVAVIGLEGFRASVGGLEAFRSDTVDEGVLIESVRDMLVHADDVGEAYVETENPAVGARFEALSDRIDQGFTDLETTRQPTRMRLSSTPEQLWLQAGQEIQIAISFPVGSTGLRLDGFHDLIDEAAAAVADMYSTNLSEVAGEISSLRERESIQLLAFLATLLISTIAAYLLARRLRRSITMPLLELELSAAHVGADDLTHRILGEGRRRARPTGRGIQRHDRQAAAESR